MAAIALPDYVYGTILPHHTLNVLQFLASPIPPLDSGALPKVVSQGNPFTENQSFITSGQMAHTLLQLPIPSPEDLAILETRLPEAVAKGCRSLAYPKGEAVLNLPLWTILFWKRARSVESGKKDWMAARNWLLKYEGEGGIGLGVLSKMPWDGIMTNLVGESTKHLLEFCSDILWLSSSHLDHLLTVLQHPPPIDMDFHIGNMFFMQKLQSVYQHTKDVYLSDKSTTYLRKIGNDLIQNPEARFGFLMAVNIDVDSGYTLLPDGVAILSNHWVSVVICNGTRVVHYGDSLDGTPPLALLEIIGWWADIHVNLLGPANPIPFIYEHMPIARQADGVSCGILAFNALEHFLHPGVDLIPDDNVDACRMAKIEALSRIASYAILKEPTSSVQHIHQELPASSTVPISTPFKPVSFKEWRTNNPPAAPRSGPPAAALHKAKVQQRKTKKNKERKSATQVLLESVGWGPGGSKKRRREEHDDEELEGHEPDAEDQSGPENLENDEDIQAENVVDLTPEELAVHRPKPGPRVGGRPRDELMDQLLVPCFRLPDCDKVVERCVGCVTVFANRSRARTLKHARNCYRLSPHLRGLAKKAMLEVAPSVQLENEVIKARTAKQTTATSPTPETPAPPKKQKQDNREQIDSFVGKAAESSRRARHAALHLAIIQLICAAGLPLSIVERREWNIAWTTADPTYHPQRKSTLEDSAIASESEKVKDLTKKILAKLKNLTLSFDGGTTRGKDAVWTIHISTEGREVYFIEGREATDQRHTAEWIRDFVMEVINDIGPSRFSGVVSDSTGNTRKARELLIEAIPTILPLADICHHFGNTIKDVVRLDHFKLIITVLRQTITKFHKSHIGTSELDTARRKLSLQCAGLEAIGKTRFGTIILSARSLQRNLPAIKEVVKRGRFDLEDLAENFEDPITSTTAKFEIGLAQLISIGDPCLKALTVLESNEATVADTFVFWHAVLFSTVSTVMKAKITSDVQTDISRILNHRHNQIMGQGQLSSPLYLAGAYLTPEYLVSDMFKKTPLPAGRAPPQPLRTEDLEGIAHPIVFLQVASALVKIGGNEVKYGNDERLHQWKDRSDEFKAQFFKEFMRYSRRQFPYNTEVDEATGILSWWNSIDGENATILPLLAVKIFSVRVNSMPEERTVSTFTWLTPALRVNLSVGMMVAMTLIRQFYATEARRGSPRHFPTPRYYREKRKEKAAKIQPRDLQDEEDDSWLDEPLTLDDFSAAGLDLDALEVNILSSMIEGVLADEKSTKKMASEKGKDGLSSTSASHAPSGTNDFLLKW